MLAKRAIGLLSLTLLMSALAIPALGQAQPGQGGRGGGFQTRIKDQLGATDDEYKALQPKIEAVMTLQRSTRGGGGFGGPGGGGGRRGQNGGGNAGGTPPAADPNAPTSPVQEKVKDLQTTLDNKDAKPEELKAKLTAVREARAKAKEELAKAQTELRDLLTQRQEAVLVMLGILE